MTDRSGVNQLSIGETAGAHWQYQPGYLTQATGNCLMHGRNRSIGIVYFCSLLHLEARVDGNDAAREALVADKAQARALQLLSKGVGVGELANRLHQVPALRLALSTKSSC